MIPKKGRSEKRMIVLQKQVEKMNKKMEQTILLNKQKYRALEEFMRLLSNFVSHDIKNSIHNMDGLISNMGHRAPTTDDVTDLELCIKTLKNALIEFNNLSDEELTENFELYKLFANLNSLHRSHFSIHKIKFSVNYGPDLKNLLIKHNFHNILQALNNMIINSCKALKDCENKFIKIDISRLDSNTLEILFADSGSGICDANKGKIFEPYFTTSDGSGVGLTHVEYTLENIGGTIELQESKKGLTIFKLIFPIKHEA